LQGFVGKPVNFAQDHGVYDHRVTLMRQSSFGNSIDDPRFMIGEKRNGGGVL
jgi:hypothetical protein